MCVLSYFIHLNIDFTFSPCSTLEVGDSALYLGLLALFCNELAGNVHIQHLLSPDLKLDM